MNQPEYTTLTDAAATLLRSRRTIHAFLPEVPPEETLRWAIDLARWAPNHRLTQPWRFYLLGPKTASAVAQRNADLVAAKRGEQAGRAKLERWLQMPGWLVVTCETNADSFREREDYAACCCAVQNLMLALWSKGIGVKWVTGKVTRDSHFYDIIGIDPNAESVVGLFWYGYPAEVPDSTRKPVTEVLIKRA